MEVCLFPILRLKKLDPFEHCNVTNSSSIKALANMEQFASALHRTSETGNGPFFELKK